MNRILIAAAATAAFVGVAAAQEAPVHIGNYGPAVVQALKSSGTAVSTTASAAPQGVDYSTTQSVDAGYPADTNANQPSVPTFAHR